jgi:hypothetical protein
LIVAADFRDKCRIGNSSAVGDMDEDEAGGDEESNTKFELRFCDDFGSP